MTIVVLRDFLAALARRPHRYGECDCALTLADWWLRARGGPDPAADLRGAYATEEECVELLRARGGLGRVVSDVAKVAGASRTEAPKPGDIAVVEIGGRHWGAIMTPSGRWTVKANEARNGFKVVSVIRAWSVL